MALLYVTEYAEVVSMPGGKVGQIPVEPPLAEQTVAIGNSSTPSNAFNASTRFVRLHTDSICGLTLGSSPTATVASGGAGSGRMVAGQTEFRAVPPRQPNDTPYKVAVIATT